MKMSAPPISLITMGIHFVVFINWVSKPTWILDIKGNSCTLKCPCLRARLTDCFCSEQRCNIIHVDAVSVSTNSDGFRRPVEGVMKLLRAWLSNFQCIFHLARINNCSCAWKNYWSITICILYVRNHFEEFGIFVEGVVGHMNLGILALLILCEVAVPKCGWNSALNFELWWSQFHSSFYTVK